MLSTPDPALVQSCLACSFAPAKAPWPRCVPCIRGTSQRACARQADIHTPTSISLRDAFPNGENSPFAACCILNYWAKFPCSAASSLCPYIGGSRQPLDRQVRYYSVTPQLASGRFEYLCCRPGTRGRPAINFPTKTPGRHSPMGWRPDSCAVTGLSEMTRRFIPPVSLQLPGRFPLWGPLQWRLLLPNSAFSWLIGTLIPVSLLHHWRPIN